MYLGESFQACTFWVAGGKFFSRQGRKMPIKSASWGLIMEEEKRKGAGSRCGRWFEKIC